MPGDPDWAGGTAFIDEPDDRRRRDPRRQVHAAACRIGGGEGLLRGVVVVEGAAG